MAAYDAMVASLQADRGTAFDRDYVDGQVDYQKGNAALFQYEIRNGFDADLKKSRAKPCRRSKIIYIERSP